MFSKSDLLLYTYETKPRLLRSYEIWGVDDALIAPKKRRGGMPWRLIGSLWPTEPARTGWTETASASDCHWAAVRFPAWTIVEVGLGRGRGLVWWVV